jgi:hypothetical protein
MRSLLFVLAGVLPLGLAACADAAEPSPVPVSVEFLSGDVQEALLTSSLPEPLRVHVTDRRSMPVPGVGVTWSATIGPISPSETATDASGIAAATWTLGTVPATYRVGTHSATATVSGLPPVSFTGHARVGIEVKSVSISPDPLTST